LAIHLQCYNEGDHIGWALDPYGCLVTFREQHEPVYMLTMETRELTPYGGMQLLGSYMLEECTSRKSSLCITREQYVWIMQHSRLVSRYSVTDLATVTGCENEKPLITVERREASPSCWETRSVLDFRKDDEINFKFEPCEGCKTCSPEDLSMKMTGVTWEQLGVVWRQMEVEEKVVIPNEDRKEAEESGERSHAKLSKELAVLADTRTNARVHEREEAAEATQKTASSGPYTTSLDFMEKENCIKSPGGAGPGTVAMTSTSAATEPRTEMPEAEPSAGAHGGMRCPFPGCTHVSRVLGSAVAIVIARHMKIHEENREITVCAGGAAHPECRNIYTRIDAWKRHSKTSQCVTCEIMLTSEFVERYPERVQELASHLNRRGGR
jgi:hypothetical protein